MKTSMKKQNWNLILTSGLMIIVGTGLLALGTICYTKGEIYKFFGAIGLFLVMINIVICYLANRKQP